jgi:hypothetical protein
LIVTIRKPAGIPTYAADGRRLRDYPESSIQRLLALDKVTVTYKRKGKIACAFFRPLDGANPLRRSAHVGTRYSFEEPLPSGHFAWKHRRLLQSQEIEELLGEPVEDERHLDLFVRSIFRAVPLSVMRTTPPSPTAPASNVISIEAGRGLRRANRKRKNFTRNLTPERRAA